MADLKQRSIAKKLKRLMDSSVWRPDALLHLKWWKNNRLGSLGKTRVPRCRLTRAFAVSSGQGKHLSRRLGIVQAATDPVSKREPISIPCGQRLNSDMLLSVVQENE